LTNRELVLKAKKNEKKLNSFKIDLNTEQNTDQNTELNLENNTEFNNEDNQLSSPNIKFKPNTFKSNSGKNLYLNHDNSKSKFLKHTGKIKSNKSNKSK